MFLTLIDRSSLGVLVKCNGIGTRYCWSFEITAPFPLDLTWSTGGLALPTIIFIIKGTPCITSEEFETLICF